MEESVFEKLEWIRIDASNIDTDNIHCAVNNISRLIVQLVDIIETDMRNRQLGIRSNLDKED